MSVLPEIPDSVKNKASDVLLNMVNVTIQTMNDVVEFGKQQIPEVIHQLLMWKAVESFLGFAMNVVLIIIAILLMTRWGKKVGTSMAEKRKKAQKDYQEGAQWTRYGSGTAVTSVSYDFFMGGSMLVRWVVVFIGGMLFISSVSAALHSLDWLKIWIAPKVYLIEYAATLVKSVK
nr:MAG TPA: hypothetical protein [Caudoviricetes sp.]